MLTYADVCCCPHITGATATVTFPHSPPPPLHHTLSSETACDLTRPVDVASLYSSGLGTNVVTSITSGGGEAQTMHRPAIDLQQAMNRPATRDWKCQEWELARPGRCSQCVWVCVLHTHDNIYRCRRIMLRAGILLQVVFLFIIIFLRQSVFPFLRRVSFVQTKKGLPIQVRTFCRNEFSSRQKSALKKYDFQENACL
jgi:hypothetical protein